MQRFHGTFRFGRRWLIVLCCSLGVVVLFPARHILTSAQSIDPANEPVLVHFHPQENIIGATNGLVFEIYTQNFEFIDQFTLLDDSKIDVLLYAFHWSPDGSKLAILLYGYGFPSTTSVLQVWDMSNTQKLYEIPDIEMLAQLAWSPDSTRFAAQIVSGRNSSVIRTFDAQSGQMLIEINPPLVISQLAWSPVGNQLVFEGYEDVQVWSTDTGRLLRTLNVTMDSEVELAFSPAENLIAFVNLSNSTIIEIWNTDTGQLVAQLEGHTAPLLTFAWNTGRLVSTALDDTVRVWDTDTGQATVFQVGRYPDAELSADGTVLLIEDGGTGIYTCDVLTGKTLSIWDSN